MFWRKRANQRTAAALWFARGAGALVLSATPSMGVAEHPTIAEYRKLISPILEDHCYECHGDGYDKGNVAFDALVTDEEILQPDLWLKVLSNTRAGLMPAEQNPRLPPAQQQALERWIKYRVFQIDPEGPDPGRVTLRRLNRVEYRNTVRDLLGVDFNAEVEFPPDDTGYGFDTIGAALTLSPMLMEKYVAAAQVIIGEAVPTTPLQPAERSISGEAFTTQDAAPKQGKLRLSYHEPAIAKTRSEVAHGGSYDLTLHLRVDGSGGFDPARCRVIFKIDDAPVLTRELGWHDARALTLELSQSWQPGEHRLAIELQPLGTVGSETPDDQGKRLSLVVDKVTIKGPLQKEFWVKREGYERFFPRAVPKSRAERRAYARELLGAFAQRAYRRPLNDDTPERLAALAEKIYSQPGKTFEQGVAHAMAAVLSSPRFLFRVERPARPASGRAAYIDEYSLASRLSYFLWSTMPDEELMQLAARGELRTQLHEQVTRMLADPRAGELARNFTGQWLQARDVEGIASNAVQILARDAGQEEELRSMRDLFRHADQDPEAAKKLAELRARFSKPRVRLDSELRTAMRRETEMFFHHVMREDRPLVELIDSTYTFMNEKLAKVYHIAGVVGPEMRKVELPEGSPRGGMLTQASSLVVTSNPDRTSPVKRGLFVLANFLGTPPPPPPANVPALEASEADIEDHEPTLREALELHRSDPACASCHNRMDPIGLAFENFNALGMWRESERKQPIVASGQLLTGESFSSVAELKRILASEHRQEFHRTITSKLLTYAIGRGLEYYDVETVDRIVQRIEHAEGRFSALLMGIIESAPFQQVRTEATLTVAK